MDSLNNYATPLAHEGVHKWCLGELNWADFCPKTTHAALRGSRARPFVAPPSQSISSPQPHPLSDRPALYAYHMPSLAQLLAAHGTLLVLDATSARVQVGWLTPDRAIWASSTDEAGKALFSGVETIFGTGDEPSAENHNRSTPPIRSISAVGAFVFCEGPGSILGIRTAATAIRAWRTLHPQTPTYSYQSLALLAHGLGDPDLALIADARRDHWHVQRLGQPLCQVPSNELADTPNTESLTPSDQCTTTRATEANALVANEPVPKKQAYGLPEGFRHWTTPPPNIARVPYDLETLFAADGIKDADLFTPAPEPDAFLHNEATYKTWTPQIHRAPSSSS